MVRYILPTCIYIEMSQDVLFVAWVQKTSVKHISINENSLLSPSDRTFSQYPRLHYSFLNYSILSYSTIPYPIRISPSMLQVLNIICLTEKNTLTDLKNILRRNSNQIFFITFRSHSFEILYRLVYCRYESSVHIFRCINDLKSDLSNYRKIDGLVFNWCKIDKCLFGGGIIWYLLLVMPQFTWIEQKKRVWSM